MNVYFPKRWLWLWGWQTHRTYICFHFGKIDVMIAWR
jgi:hypothetical protein